MNRAEYLSSLRKLLSNLPTADMEDALDYYDGYIADAEDEAAEIARLGPPSDVAAQIMANYAAKNTSSATYAAGNIERNSAWNILKGFLSIIALPFAVIGILLLACIGIVIIALGFSGAVAVLAGIAAIAFVPFVFFQQFISSVTMLGTGLAAIGFGILLIEGARYLWRTGVYWVLRILGRKVSEGGR